MTIRVEVISDSISPQGIRLVTMQLKYPRFVHAEFMTHRVFSRNASSSRAIPVERLIRDVFDDPVYPQFWGKNRPGMQAAEECNSLIYTHPGNFGGVTREDVWDWSRRQAVHAAQALAVAGYHKQIVNRLLEPFCHINVVVTATEWSNFFALRCHPDAQPEMRMLAEAMRSAMADSEPRPLRPGEWHLPYFDPEKDDVGNWLGSRANPIELAQETCIKISVARCARVSYLTQDGKKPTIEEDIKLYDRLVSSVPLHASPAEHQATPDDWVDAVSDLGYSSTSAAAQALSGWKHPELHGNLVGWCQFRKYLPGECQ